MPRPHPPTLLRSLLFTPGSNERMLSKASTSGADCALLDLEDSVTPDQKEAARPMVLQAIKQIRAADGAPPVIAVRVNGVASGLLDADLQGVVCPELDLITLAMTTSAADIRTADVILTQLEHERGLEANAIGVIALIETALGVHNCYAICTAAERMLGITLGSSEAGDLYNDLGATWAADGASLLYARSKALLEARAAGIPFPTDGPFTRIDDPDGCRADAMQARQIGYIGKSAIHPSQVVIINEVFSPAVDEIDYLRQMIDAYHEAERAGLGALTFRGRMIDIAMVKDGERVLALADAIAARGQG